MTKRWCLATLPAWSGAIAQWLEQATHNRLVAGSNPAGPTIPFSLAIAQHSCQVGYL